MNQGTADVGFAPDCVVGMSIGAISAEIRGRVCRDAAWLGVVLDDPANQDGGPRISTAASKVSAWVLPTNEELMIARHTRRALG